MASSEEEQKRSDNDVVMSGVQPPKATFISQLSQEAAVKLNKKEAKPEEGASSLLS